MIPFLIYLITLGAIIKMVLQRRKNHLSNQYFASFAVFWIFLGPGISALYPALEKFEFFAPSELTIFFQLSTVEFFGESLPQLVIQGINNTLQNNWTSFTKFSFTISFISLIRGCYVLATTWYRRQYETFIDQIKKHTLKRIKRKVMNEPLYSGNEQVIDTLIEYKFLEKFYLNKVLFNINNDVLLELDKDLHIKIENVIDKIYEKKCGLNFNTYNFTCRLMHPLNLLIFLELLLVSIVWVFNFVYFIEADSQMNL